mmetsp:Transcript_37408/g.119993  ORF Transcript_37408/g.119993 Transcript_37408/m.119993 type:complete len:145 (-) Transcript_37408:333-767(-)
MAPKAFLPTAVGVAALVGAGAVAPVVVRAVYDWLGPFEGSEGERMRYAAIWLAPPGLVLALCNEAVAICRVCSADTIGTFPVACADKETYLFRKLQNAGRNSLEQCVRFLLLRFRDDDDDEKNPGSRCSWRRPSAWRRWFPSRT